jgi:hypothetical protein
MRLLGVDPETSGNGSPTIWEDGDAYVIQGWRIIDPAIFEEIGEIPARETVLRIPKRMVQFLPEFRQAGGRSGE